MAVEGRGGTILYVGIILDKNMKGIRVGEEAIPTTQRTSTRMCGMRVASRSKS